MVVNRLRFREVGDRRIWEIGKQQGIAVPGKKVFKPRNGLEREKIS
jgi:hypothetical protein